MNVFADTFACCLCRLLSIQEMWGLELNDDFPVRAQRFVRINRRVSLSPMRNYQPASLTNPALTITFRYLKPSQNRNHEATTSTMLRLV